MPLEHQVKQSLRKPLTMIGNLIRDLQSWSYLLRFYKRVLLLVYTRVTDQK